jgi:hypothetical protein
VPTGHGPLGAAYPARASAKDGVKKGDTITHTQANYYACPSCYSYDVNPTEGYHPTWDDIWPFTSAVGADFQEEQIAI